MIVIHAAAYLLAKWRAARAEGVAYRADQRRIARLVSMSNHPAGKGRT